MHLAGQVLQLQVLRTHSRVDQALVRAINRTVQAPPRANLQAVRLRPVVRANLAPLGLRLEVALIVQVLEVLQLCRLDRQGRLFLALALVLVESA
jgi:hypothetical protein